MNEQIPNPAPETRSPDEPPRIVQLGWPILLGFLPAFLMTLAGAGGPKIGSPYPFEPQHAWQSTLMAAAVLLGPVYLTVWGILVTDPVPEDDWRRGWFGRFVQGLLVAAVMSALNLAFGVAGCSMAMDLAR